MKALLMFSAMALSGGAVAGDTAAANPPRSITIQSPNPLPDDGRISVFLAGSIDMGGSVDWQAQVARELADEGVVLLNPRRDDWNPAWKPSAEEPEFRRQVEWELAALQRADVIAMYFAPGSQSPVTLLELGLHAGSGKLLLACPDGFWRKGNVEITADRYHVPRFESLPELVAAVRERVNRLRRARRRRPGLRRATDRRRRAVYRSGDPTPGTRAPRNRLNGTLRPKLSPAFARRHHAVC